MDVGIGLPNTIPGTDGRLVVEWARRADQGPFSTLGVLDRLAYDAIDAAVALAAAAGVTERIGLATMIAIGPLRNTALLARQAASVDALSGKRLTLGLAVGARLDDYETAEVDHRGRGARLSEQLAAIRDGGGLGVREDLRVLVGGMVGPAFARMARYADGYAHNGGPPRAFERAAASALAAWSDLGRPGRPLLWGQGYFALGDEDLADAYLRDYYAFTGPFAEKIAAGNLSSGRAVKDFVRGYEDAGCDHLVLLPTVSDPAQLDRLADVLG